MRRLDAELAKTGASITRISPSYVVIGWSDNIPLADGTTYHNAGSATGSEAEAYAKYQEHLAEVVQVEQTAITNAQTQAALAADGGTTESLSKQKTKTSTKENFITALTVAPPISSTSQGATTATPMATTLTVDEQAQADLDTQTAKDLQVAAADAQDTVLLTKVPTMSTQQMAAYAASVKTGTPMADTTGLTPVQQQALSSSVAAQQKETEAMMATAAQPLPKTKPVDTQAGMTKEEKKAADMADLTASLTSKSKKTKTADQKLATTPTSMKIKNSVFTTVTFQTTDDQAAIDLKKAIITEYNKEVASSPGFVG